MLSDLPEDAFTIDKTLSFFYSACKPEKLIGVELEFFCVDKVTKIPLSFFGEFGLKKIMEKFRDNFNYTSFEGTSELFELKREDEYISLEPGGQIEYSSPPLKTIQECDCKVQMFLTELRSIVKGLGNIEIISIGAYMPSLSQQTVEVPKERYKLLADYLSKKGTHGIQMMKCTSSIHINLDYSNEDNAMEILRLAMYASPIASCIFANSPYEDSLGNNYKIYRKEIWNNTDVDRCGLILSFFDRHKRFIDYINYILRIPIIYLNRDSNWILVDGKSNFIDYIKYGIKGLKPTMRDFFIHANSVFYDARLKSYIEIRGIDAQPINALLTPAYFWKGLVLDDKTMRKALKLLSAIPKEEMFSLQQKISVGGLDCFIKAKKIETIAQDLLSISKEGIEKELFKLRSLGM